MRRLHTALPWYRDQACVVPLFAAAVAIAAVGAFAYARSGRLLDGAPALRK